MLNLFVAQPPVAQPICCSTSCCSTSCCSTYLLLNIIVAQTISCSNFSCSTSCCSTFCCSTYLLLNLFVAQPPVAQPLVAQPICCSTTGCSTHCCSSLVSAQKAFWALTILYDWEAIFWIQRNKNNKTKKREDKRIRLPYDNETTKQTCQTRMRLSLYPAKRVCPSTLQARDKHWGGSALAVPGT